MAVIMFLSVIYLYFCIYLTMACDSVLYHKDSQYTDLQCSTVTYNLGTARSKLDCSVRCGSDSDCRSFFYNVNSGMCDGITSIITSTSVCTSNSGYVYYVIDGLTTTTTTTSTTTSTTTTTTTTTTVPPQYNSVCATDSDCLISNTACLDSRCKCSLGYRHVPSDDTCTQNCATYGSTYIFIPDKALQTNAIDSQYVGSVTQCMTLCSTYPTCTGFNFCASCGNFCRCKTGSPLDSPTIFTDYPGVDYYSRNCA